MPEAFVVLLVVADLLLAGLLWGELGSSAPFLAGALFAAVALVGMLILRRRLS